MHSYGNHPRLALSAWVLRPQQGLSRLIELLREIIRPARVGLRVHHQVAVNSVTAPVHAIMGTAIIRRRIICRCRIIR